MKWSVLARRAAQIAGGAGIALIASNAARRDLVAPAGEAPAPIVAVTTVVVPAAPTTALASCPTPPVDEVEPIGHPARPDDLSNPAPWRPRPTIATSRVAPVIAVRDEPGVVSASVDDGRTFVRVLRERWITGIAVDDRGRIYGAADGAVGIRDTLGRERWTELPCRSATCDDRVVALGRSVVWIHDGELRATYGTTRWDPVPAGDPLRAQLTAPPPAARDLRIDHGTLIEQCGPDQRVIARGFRFDRVDAVDAGGRPLFASGEAIVRWSSRFGWRTLRPAPSAPWTPDPLGP
jgi:hypothetical protein